MLLLFIQLHKIPGKSWNFVESPGKSEKKCWKVLEFETIFWWELCEKSCIKCGGKTIPRAFFKKSKLSISLYQYCKVLNSLVLNSLVFEGYRKIVKSSCRPLAFTYYKAFLKNKKRSGTSFPTSFSA